MVGCDGGHVSRFCAYHWEEIDNSKGISRRSSVREKITETVHPRGKGALQRGCKYAYHTIFV